ncbi:MAG: NADH-quinone oxidoreductase subunit NuoK [Bacteroidota bacterium]
MSSIPMEYYLILSAFMFAVGVTGVLIRRNAIVVFMCIELMLNAANLTLVTFSSYTGNPVGQIFVFFVMTVAAAEAAVGLAIIIAIFRNKLTVNIDEINIFKW